MTEVRITHSPLRIRAYVPRLAVDLSCEACRQREAVDFHDARWLCAPCIARTLSDGSGSAGDPDGA